MILIEQFFVLFKFKWAQYVDSILYVLLKYLMAASVITFEINKTHT